MLSIKNVIIGIDGGCFEQIFPLIKKNLLPNFKKMINDGFYAKLNVTIPPITVPSWPCLFSGITPDQLGFSYFSHPKKGLFNSSFWRDYSIFSIPLIRSFVLNIPGTYPAWRINGEMFSGLMSPRLTCYPKELEFIYGRNWISGGNSLSQNFKAFNMKKKIFMRKLHEDFDLLIYVIRLPDAISHLGGIRTKEIVNFINLSYIKIDEFLGKLLRIPDLANIIIFSDHGLKVYSKVINLFPWFRKKGILPISYQPKENSLRWILLKLYGFIRHIIKPNVYLINVYNNILKKKTPKGKKKPKKSKTTIQISKYCRLQSYKSNVGGLFLHGKLKHKKTQIKAELEKEKFVKKVILTDSEDAPDLFIILKESYYFDIETSFIKRKTEILTHSIQGIFMAYGEDIKRGKSESVNYYDIAPTILKLFSIEKQNYMVGEPLNIFKDKYV